MNTITAVKGIVLSFKGKEMSHDQNMAVFDLIESVLGEEAADAFSNSMESSDENHNSATTYVYAMNVETAWKNIIDAVS